MANEIRLVDANALWHKTFTCEDAADVRKEIENAPTVDAVVLPCKIGDLVYFHHIEGLNEDGSPIERVRTGQVYQICIEQNNEIWIRVSFGIWYCCRRYTDFYFSKEEAEEALAKMDGGADDVH